MLQGMPHLVRGDRRRGQRSTQVILPRKPDGFLHRIVMVAPVRRFDLHRMQPRGVEQQSRRVGAASFVTHLGPAVTIHDPPDPDVGTDDQGHEGDNDYEEVHVSIVAMGRYVMQPPVRASLARDGKASVASKARSYRIGSRKKKKDPRKMTRICRRVRTTSGKLPIG